MHVSVSLSDDPIFLLLHLWVNWWNPELPVCPRTGQASGHHALSSSGCHVSSVSGHQQLHAVHVVDLQTGQQRTAAHVPGERTFTASLARNGREGTTEAGMFVQSVCAGSQATFNSNRFLNVPVLMIPKKLKMSVKCYNLFHL